MCASCWLYTNMIYICDLFHVCIMLALYKYDLYFVICFISIMFALYKYIFFVICFISICSLHTNVIVICDLFH